METMTGTFPSFFAAAPAIASTGSGRQRQRVAPASTEPERRRSGRFPLEFEVRYRLPNTKQVSASGCGKTRNVSSTGVLFACDEMLPRGAAVELSIAWPVKLNVNCRLRLVVFGCIVRCDHRGTAVKATSYEFRTQAIQSATAGSAAV